MHVDWSDLLDVFNLTDVLNWDKYENLTDVLNIDVTQELSLDTLDELTKKLIYWIRMNLKL